METETQTNAPICKTQICKRPLTFLEGPKCWRCLVCNPIPKDVPKAKQEKKFLDVKMTDNRVREILGEQIIVSEERIREIVQDELMNWHIQKPPVTKTEIEELSEPEGSTTATDISVQPLTWRQQAKELGISLHQSTGGVRKKVDVLADIEAKTEMIVVD